VRLIQCTRRIKEFGAPPAGGKRHDIVSRRGHSGDRDLRHTDLFGGGDGSKWLDQRLVAVNILSSKA